MEAECEQLQSLHKVVAHNLGTGKIDTEPRFSVDSHNVSAFRLVILCNRVRKRTVSHIPPGGVSNLQLSLLQER